MDTIVFGEYTVQDLVIAGVLILGVIILLVILAKVFSKGKSSQHSQPVACRCGWRGQVSRYAGCCPKCNQPLGEQKATPFRK